MDFKKFYEGAKIYAPVGPLKYKCVLACKKSDVSQSDAPKDYGQFVPGVKEAWEEAWKEYCEKDFSKPIMALKLTPEMKHFLENYQNDNTRENNVLPERHYTDLRIASLLADEYLRAEFDLLGRHQHHRKWRKAMRNGTLLNASNRMTCLEDWDKEFAKLVKRRLIIHKRWLK